MFSKTTRVDEPESLVESDQVKPGQCKQRKSIYQETDGELVISTNIGTIPR